ncbi:MucB/RseB C-terminal domain-containing protein [Halomonas sp. BM-2019]|uniref:MucB/RseB C-terminal domain-containing protein n=1 Tax=Halomonas sp. BM-2019 TaxID=2811227 RepID=UPI0031FD7D46
MTASRLSGRLAIALGLLLLVGSFPVAHAEVEEERFDCRTLEDQPRPESALGWFERSLWAGHCYLYEAHAVRIGYDGVRTLAISHEVRDGIERGVATFLDGPPMVFERRGRIGRLGWAGEAGEAPPSPAGIVERVDGLYRLQLGGEERIANRRARRLDIAPLDSFRFGHRLWLDQATGLTLKQTLLDETGRPLETFQLTALERPRLHQGEVVLDRQREAPADPWRLGWLPEGFTSQPVDTRSARHGEEIIHRLYSDGLSTLSVFVAPLDQAELLAPGLHRLGVSNAAVRHRDLGGEPRQLVVMGEMPPRVLLRVADGLEWQEAPSP